MQIGERLPLAEVVEKDRRRERIILGEVGVLSRCVYESASSIRCCLGGKGQYVIRAFHGMGEEDNAEAWPLPLLAAESPLR